MNGTDKNYKSINGDIYTKDGKSLVRIVSSKKFDLYSNLTYVEDEYTYKGAYKEHAIVTRMNFEDKTIKPENLEAFLERVNCADKNKAEIIAQFAK